jgi:hypothetical protein
MRVGKSSAGCIHIWLTMSALCQPMGAVRRSYSHLAAQQAQQLSCYSSRRLRQGVRKSDPGVQLTLLIALRHALFVIMVHLSLGASGSADRAQRREKLFLSIKQHAVVAPPRASSAAEVKANWGAAIAGHRGHALARVMSTLMPLGASVWLIVRSAEKLFFVCSIRRPRGER